MPKPRSLTFYLWRTGTNVADKMLQSSFLTLVVSPFGTNWFESTDESFFGNAIMDIVMLTLPTAKKEIYECCPTENVVDY